MIFELISRGASIGFMAGASPGPFQGFLIAQTLRHGWRRTVTAAFAPLIADGPIILLAVVILRQIPPEWVRLIQLIGGLYLLWLAAQGLRAWLRGVGGLPDGSAPVQERSLGKAVLMIWLSPGPYVFWTTLLGPLLVSGLEQSLWAGLAFLLSFYGVFIGLLLLYVLAFNQLRKMDPRVVRGVTLLTVLLLGYFALELIARGLGLLT